MSEDLKQLSMEGEEKTETKKADEVTLVSKNDIRDWERLSLVKRTNGFPSSVERYFSPRFHLDPSEQMEDQLILLHSNRVAVVCLAPSHPILRDHLKVDKIDFQINDTLNRLANKVSGKWKRGGQRLKKDSQLCTIQSQDRVFSLKACVPGTLVEVNARLCEDVSLLSRDSFNTGYIAVILPPLHLETELRENAYTPPDAYIEIRKPHIHGEFLR